MVSLSVDAGASAAPLRVLAFFTGRNDPAHISFVHEANRWFAAAAKTNGFTYDSTSDWSRMNSRELAACDLVLFLDTRPEGREEREAFRAYMENGGAWIGFHFSAFALTPSAYNQDWDWYHNVFLGSGEYAGNKWRPAPARLRVEASKPALTRGLGKVIPSAANEWYRWKNDLRRNPDIEVLLSIDPSSFPLGTGPKAAEIWHSGDYPVAWRNRRYNMIYINMGHNDMDYGHPGERQLSSTFASAEQNRFILNAIRWLGRRPVKKRP